MCSVTTRWGTPAACGQRGEVAVGRGPDVVDVEQVGPLAPEPPPGPQHAGPVPARVHLARPGRPGCRAPRARSRTRPRPGPARATRARPSGRGAGAWPAPTPPARCRRRRCRSRPAAASGVRSWFAQGPAGAERLPRGVLPRHGLQEAFAVAGGHPLGMPGRALQVGAGAPADHAGAVTRKTGRAHRSDVTQPHAHAITSCSSGPRGNAAGAALHGSRCDARTPRKRNPTIPGWRASSRRAKKPAGSRSTRQRSSIHASRAAHQPPAQRLIQAPGSSHAAQPEPVHGKRSMILLADW